MATKGMLKGVDGHYHPEWETAWGPMPEGYPSKRTSARSRAATPVQTVQTTKTLRAGAAGALGQAASIATTGAGVSSRWNGNDTAPAPRPTGRPKRAARCCTPAARRRWAWNVAWLLLGLAGMSGNTNLVVNSAVKAGAAITDAAEAASSIVVASANATVAVSSAALAFIHTGTGTVEDIWHGVDLHDVVLHVEASRVAARDASHLKTWIEENLGQTLPATAKSRIAALVSNISADMPFLDNGQESLNVSGQLFRWRLQCRMVEQRYVVASWWVMNASFRAEWANPAWDMVGFDVRAESARIASAIQLAANELAPSDSRLLPIDDKELPALLRDLKPIAHQKQQILQNPNVSTWAKAAWALGWCLLGCTLPRCFHAILGLYATWRYAETCDAFEDASEQSEHLASQFEFVGAAVSAI